MRLKQRISSLQARPPRLKMLFLCVLIHSSGTLLFTAWFSVDQLWFFAAVHYCCCCRWPGTGRRWSCRMGTGFTPPASATPSPSAWTGWARRTLPATPAGLRTASRERSQPPYKSQVCQIYLRIFIFAMFAALQYSEYGILIEQEFTFYSTVYTRDYTVYCIQKRMQISSLLLGGHNYFNSLLR